MPVRRPRIESPIPTPPTTSPAPPDSRSTVLSSSSPTSDGRPRKKSKLFTKDLVTRTGRSRVRRNKTTPRQKALQLARSIRRSVDLYVNIPQAVNTGRAYDSLEQYKKMSPTDEKYDKKEKETAEGIVAHSGRDLNHLLKVYRLVNQNADAGRNDDTGKLKDHAHKYVLKTGQIDPPLDNKSKLGRGTSHPQLMREIIPMSVLHKYGQNENFEDMVKAKKFKLKHNNATAFLYDKELWDPKNPDIGLLKGHFPIMVLRQILFGPKAATSTVGSRTIGTRKNNAEISGVNKITPEMIAYACARFFICKLEQYSEFDEDFSFKSFYNWILKFFEEADEDWVQDTLTYWNDKTFGPVDDLVDIEDEDDEDDETSFTNILTLQRE
ncbi:hypothetical protein A7U60_g2628 [Sanghuangporus baumii]|uniref:Uncharacterized protein n=1 Tax=Sanghuangporus baumii TaxID=108892 RepID=A0A9Q5N7X8_SANBA|nr:hypothetical protein A7U60_g2628 [Sanghuangporus baumii]